MGKIRKRKPHKTKINDIEVALDSEEFQLDSKENVIQTIIDQIQVRLLK